ncbi:hypothetical protein [Pontibacter sp. G13]|uniref:hypothetical protein n=1 Tax=Pontibacter sp. G13 TaxID=3074898 RepID=UPI0028899CB3|nr:hypothetical protein [Pontibacter sp. G13]WNJ17176.1 hypothetical protein RJD25_20155 [Pontibacter sp. G13]
MMVRSRCLLVSCLIVFHISLKGQDAQYWSQQYGTRSTLLGGVVIGSVEDLGATYYNPARLALVPDLSFLLSAKVYELESFSLKNSSEQGAAVNNYSVGVAPNLAAGTISPSNREDQRIAYSFLTRQRADFRLDFTEFDTLDIIQGDPGDELVGASGALNQKVDENWFGASYAKPFSRHLSWGVSGFVTVRSQRTNRRYLVETFNANGNVGILNQISNFQYNVWGLVFKGGLAYEKDPWSAGLTITTPRIRLFGQGSVEFNTAQAGVDVDGDGTDDDRLIVQFQEKVKAFSRLAMSIGAGAAYRIKGNKIHVSAEWFPSVASYHIMDPRDFLNQITRDTLSRTIVDETNAVFNFGLGYEGTLAKRWSIYGAFSTDNSAVSDNQGGLFDTGEDSVSSSLAFWDLFHLSTGTAFTWNRADITLGLIYSAGRDDVFLPIDLPEQGNAFSRGDEGRFTYRRLRLIFGFAFNFGPKKSDSP